MRFEDSYQRAPCGLLVATAGGEVTDVNDTFLRWIGFGRDELVGRRFEDLLDPAGTLFYETRHIQVLRLQGEVREVALTLRRKDGGALPVLVNSTLDEDGTIRTAIFDATARQEYERDLLVARRQAEEAAARVRVLQEASVSFATARSEQEIAQALADQAREAFTAATVAVLLADADGRLTLAAGEHPYADELADDVWRPEDEVVRTGRPFVLTSIDEAATRWPALADALRATRHEAIILTALRHGGEILGALICGYRRQRRGDEVDLEQKAALAALGAEVVVRLRLQARLERLALYDQLTAVANRQLLEERVADTMEEARATGRPMALLFLDLDGFKHVNDMLGHATGDQVLQEIARRLRESVRAEDTVGRFGGDEFVVVCSDADAEVAAGIAERVRAAVSEPIEGLPRPVTVTASIGVTVLDEHTSLEASRDDLLNLADDAMYAAKAAGKDRVLLR